MTTSVNAPALPLTVKVAAWLLAGSGATVLVYAIVSQALLEWDQAWELVPSAIRFLGMSLIAWGLLKRARWAWWLGVLIPTFFLLAVVVAVVAAFPAVRALDLPLPPGFLPVALVSVAAMATAVILLLLPVSRAAFRRAAT